MNVTKVKCELCGREISKNNYSKHIRRHENHPETFEVPKWRLDHDGLNCQYCGKECKNKNSLCNHERLCKLNPDRDTINAYIARKALKDLNKQIWNKGLTKETDDRIKKQVDTYNKNKDKHKSSVHPASDSQIDKMMKSYKLTLNSRKMNGRYLYKFGHYKGINCDSGWELAFLVYMLDHGENIRRNKEGFDYFIDNEKHRFYPDFIIDDTYYEIKGRFDNVVEAKISCFPSDKKLVVISGKEIKPYINYCVNTYGKDYLSTLYDKDMPSWDKVIN